MSAIPKIIYMCWNDPDVVTSESPMILNGLRNLVEFNPGWRIMIYADADIEAELKQHLDPDDYAMLAPLHIVAKSDLWRLFKMYTTGGVYVDLDRFCNVALDSLITEQTRWVLPTWQEYDFSQDFMMSAPGNPVYHTAIDMVLHRRRAGNNNTYFLGPQTYMHAITHELVGRVINTNPGAEVFEEIRTAIAAVPFITTYRETSPYDTVIYRHDPATFKVGKNNITDWQQLKQEFYAESGIRHWTGDW